MIKKELLRFFRFSIIMMIIASISYADKIHLKNGSVIRGEIISFNDTSVTIMNPASGIMEISREKIIKIEPPLEEKEIKKERLEAEIQRQEERYYVDFREKEKKLISIYLGGGLNIINGGDLNGVIQDYKQLIEDLNDYYTTDYTADLKEFKWIQNYKGEVLLNLSRSFSIGLGVEYLTKKNKGTITFSDEYSGTVNKSFYYYNYSLTDNHSEEPEYELIAIPVTFNIYYFIPITKRAEFFITGGIGYYFGKLKYNMPYISDQEYTEDQYLNDGTYLDTWIRNYSYTGTESYEVKCNEVGFHGGLGFEYKIFSNISLVAEGNYRYVKFKDWNGSWSDNWNWDRTWGWSDTGYSEDSGSETDSIDSGKIWYYEEEYSDLGKQYRYMQLYEEEPIPDPEEGISNIRQAKINLNGFSFRIGIKISF